MDYKRIYDSLISRAVNRGLTESSDVYVEIHHIVPKCLGGSNDPSNLVGLTGPEHFLAHQLLVKIHPGNRKLVYAAHMMTITSARGKRRGTNKDYGWLKALRSKAMSELHMGRTVSDETRQLMSAKAKIRGNNGWFGRKHTEAAKAKMSASKQKSQKGSGNTNSKVWAIEFPDGDINNVKCLRDFCRDIGCTVYMMRSNKVDGYKFHGVVH